MNSVAKVHFTDTFSVNIIVILQITTVRNITSLLWFVVNVIWPALSSLHNIFSFANKLYINVFSRRVCSFIQTQQ